MPVPASSKKYSWYTLGGAVVIGVVALLCNQPGSKDLKFDIVCETFTAPAPLTLNLNQYPTELVSVIAYDFHGSLSDAPAVRFAPDKLDLTLLPIHTLTLKAADNPNQPLSYLNLTRTGEIGKLLLEVSPRVELGSMRTIGAAPSLTLESRAEDDTSLTISSAQITLNEGNRYFIPEIQPNHLFDAFHSVLAGKDLVALDLHSGGWPKTRAELTFKTDSRNLPLLESAQTLPVGATLTFTRAINPYLLLDSEAVEGVITDRKVDLIVESKSATIDTIAIVSDGETREGPALRVTGTGKIKSLRQGGHQLMPTRLDEVLDMPVGKRTFWLVFLGALAAAFLKTVDHVMSVILESLFPKE
jgi:hypothetical protein